MYMHVIDREKKCRKDTILAHPDICNGLYFNRFYVYMQNCHSFHK